MSEAPVEPSATLSYSCNHGGAFFGAIGEDFSDLQRRRGVINADVLDAWFPPAPEVLAVLQEHLDWLTRTSPPTHCEGLVRTIAERRGVPVDCILPGAGSSGLIYRAFAQWFSPATRALVLDPTYGEYLHVCRHLLDCHVDHWTLRREEDYRFDAERWLRQVRTGAYDVAVIVNPNNPTGQYVARPILEEVLAQVPTTTLVWIDEAYLDYVGADQSLERFAVDTPNVVVCKSLSKVYALSGMRAAYLCGAAETVGTLRAWTPPWVIGLPAQAAAVKALQAPDYYQARYRETHVLRSQLAAGLRRQHANWDVLESVANFVLCHLPADGPAAAAIVERCQARGLFLRDVGVMGTQLARHALRIAVKDAATQERMLAILEEVS